MSITVVQSTGNSAFSTAATYPQAFVSNNTAGNALVACFWCASTASAETVTDSLGNIWTQVGIFLSNGSADQICVFKVPSCLAGANTVTAHTNDGSKAGNLFCIAEISGVNTIDQNTGQSNGTESGGVYTTPSITTQTASEIIIAAYQSGAQPTPGNVAPMLLLGHASGGSSYGIAGYQIVSSVGTYGASINGLGGSGIGAVIFSLYFKSPGPTPIGWSPKDCRNYGSFPNTGIAQTDGSVNYSANVPSCGVISNSQASDNAAIPPTDSRIAGKVVDSRTSTPVNSRVSPNGFS